ncbi:MAG: SH3 domain-containing protein [Clostridium sp.]|nr:SH3 domain-containing protein [Clostridium sp.]
MFGIFKKKYNKDMYMNNATSRVYRDEDIESNSIKITKDLDTRDDFYKVDNFFASDDHEYLQIASGEVDNIMGKVMPKSLKLRQDIGSDGEVIEMLEQNEEVSIIKAFNGWYYIETSRGTCGWCMCCHIDTNINGYDREHIAKARNEHIEKTLEKTKNGLVNPTDEPTKIRKFNLFR